MNIKCLKLAVLTALVSCGPTKESVSVIEGAPGAKGSNGHSLVSESTQLELGSLECASGGQSLDAYLDLDDSLSVSESDSYQSSIVACNGSNGLDGAVGAIGAQGPEGVAGPQGEPGVGIQGPAGAQGPAGGGATVTALTSNSCTLVAGSNSYYTKLGSLYEAAGCDAHDKVALQEGESVFVGNLTLVVKGPSGLRSITFN